MTTSYLNVSSAGALSADILAVDLASQADGGNGTHYNITLQAGASLTVNDGDIYAINLAGNDTLTLDGQGAVLSGADTYRGLFVYSGKTTIENLTIENAVAQGGGAASATGAAAGERGSAAACSSPTIPPARPRRRSRSTMFSSLKTRRSAAPAGEPRTTAVWAAGAGSAAPADLGLAAAPAAAASAAKPALALAARAGPAATSD